MTSDRGVSQLDMTSPTVKLLRCFRRQGMGTGCKCCTSRHMVFTGPSRHSRSYVLGTQMKRRGPFEDLNYNRPSFPGLLAIPRVDVGHRVLMQVRQHGAAGDQKGRVAASKDIIYLAQRASHDTSRCHAHHIRIAADEGTKSWCSTGRFDL